MSHSSQRGLLQASETSCCIHGICFLDTRAVTAHGWPLREAPATLVFLRMRQKEETHTCPEYWMHGETVQREGTQEADSSLAQLLCAHTTAPETALSAHAEPCPPAAPSLWSQPHTIPFLDQTPHPSHQARSGSGPTCCL